MQDPVHSSSCCCSAAGSWQQRCTCIDSVACVLLGASFLHRALHKVLCMLGTASTTWNLAVLQVRDLLSDSSSAVVSSLGCCCSPVLQ